MTGNTYPMNPGQPSGTLDAMGTGTITGHLRDLQLANRSPATIYQRRRCLTRFTVRTGVHPIDATPADVDAWWDRPTSPEYRACELSHLRQFYAWAQRRDLRGDDPTGHIQRPSLPRRLPRPIPTGDLADALTNAPDRIRPWLYLAAYAGLRAAEVAQLRADAIHFDGTPPLLVIERSKGGGMSSVPLHPHLAAVLDGCDLPATGHVFRRCDGQPGPNAPWTISQLSNQYLRSRGTRATFHSLRHWFGTAAYQASGRDLRVTQELLRHSSPVSTAIYTFVDPGRAMETVEGMPVIS